MPATAGTHAELLVHIYKCVFWPFGIFSSSGRGSFLVFSPPSHAWSPPEPRTNVWALAEVRGTCSWGSKWQLRSGRDYQHVEPSRPLQTHLQVKRMSGGYNVISGILNVINIVRQDLLGDGNVFPRHQHARHATTFNTIR